MADTFTQRFQVRFDECALDGATRASTLLRYVIETAFGHSSAVGYPLAWYNAHGLFWLVRRVRLRLPRPLVYGGVVDVTTRVVAFRRSWARRQNVLRDAAGEWLGEVTTDWIFTDREGRPTRVPPEMEDAFPTLSERAEVGRLNIGDPPEGLQPIEYEIPVHQIDPRGHMSTAAYLDLFEDTLAALGTNPQERPVQYDLEYLRSALAGDVLRRIVWTNPAGCSIVASFPDGAPVLRGRRKRTLEMDAEVAEG